jgi:hypothetical protein
MKTMNLKKKLTLNKKTIADFEIPETKDIYGGTDSRCHFPCLPDSMQGIPCLTDSAQHYPCTDLDCSVGCPTATGDPCKLC